MMTDLVRLPTAPRRVVFTPALTARRRVLLAALADHIRRTGYAPTLRTLGALTHTRSVSTVAWHIQRLIEAEYITAPTDSNHALLAHTMKLTERGERAAQAPESIALWRESQSNTPLKHG